MDEMDASQYYAIHSDINIVRLEPIVLKNLPIIPSQTSQKFYPLFIIKL